MCWRLKKSCKVKPSALNTTLVDVKPTPQPIGEKMPDNLISVIANAMVNNDLITEHEAREQVAAINNFFEGKITYAEMRMRAG